MPIDHSLRPERLILDSAEAEAQCDCDDHDRFAGELADALDDRTIRYVLETRAHFEDLRNAVGQVAGMLVLAAAGAKTVTQDHPLLATARRRSNGSATVSVPRIPAPAPSITTAIWWRRSAPWAWRSSARKRTCTSTASIVSASIRCSSR